MLERLWREITWQRAASGFVIFVVLYVVLKEVHPSLILSSTTIDGGDTGAHVATALYLRQQGLNGWLTPWDPGWFNGYPLYTYYFVLPDALVAAASYVINYAVAFKIGTLLGSLLMPIAAFTMGKLFRAPDPIPAALAGATLPFLFDSSYTIVGGNLLSTFAGEYSYSLSLALALITVGLFARGVRTHRGKWLAALVLSLTLAAHVLPWIFAIGIIGIVLVVELIGQTGFFDEDRSERRRHHARRAIWFVASAGTISLGLSAWWLLPFATTQQYTTSLSYINLPTTSISDIFSFLGWFDTPSLTYGATAGDRWVLCMAAVAFVAAFFWRDRLGVTLSLSAVAAFFWFVLDPQGTIWNGRIQPFWFISVYLLAGWLTGSILWRGARAWSAWVLRRYQRYIAGAELLTPATPLRLLWRAWSRHVPASEAVPVAHDVAEHRVRRLFVRSLGARYVVGFLALVAHGSGRTLAWLWSRPRRLMAVLSSDPALRDRPAGRPRSSRTGFARTRTATRYAVASVRLGGRALRRTVVAVTSIPARSSVAPLLRPWSPGGSDVREPALNSEERALYSSWRSNAVVAVTFVVALLALGSTVPGLVPSWASAVGVKPGPDQVSNWATYNYEGYQKQPGWSEYAGILATLESLSKQYGCGRAMWEYSPSETRFGTTEALMLLPYWTNNCIASEEGLLFESSATTPYHFLDQAELSASPSDAVNGLDYGPVNVALGIEHLQMLGVKYFFCFSKAVVAGADADPDLIPVAVSRVWPLSGVAWHFYVIKDAPLVAPVTELPNVVANVNGRVPWLTANQAWWLDPTKWSVLYAASGPANWPRVDSPDYEYRKKVPSTTVSDIVAGDQSISFHVSRIGVPVVVKISYYPRWRATGATGPYQVSPNLMVVVPTSHDVSLVYGSTPAVTWGGALTALTLVALVVVIWRRRWWRRPRDAPAR